MKAYGEWSYTSIIHDIGTRWRWVVSFTSQPLYLRGNGPPYPLDRRPCGPRAGLDAMEKRKILSVPEVEPRPSSPYCIAITTELVIPALCMVYILQKKNKTPVFHSFIIILSFRLVDQPVPDITAFIVVLKIAAVEFINIWREAQQ
jgi:hypothetical protein